jgi:sigma54-dependent transcription regulator
MELERKYLTQIAKKNGGMLMVDQVIELARDEDSILHKHFTWDDTKAADAYRKQQDPTMQDQTGRE